MNKGAGAIALASSFARATAVREAKPRLDLVVDLGERVGSPAWWRGIATLGALVAAVIHVAPPFPDWPPDRIVVSRAAAVPAPRRPAASTRAIPTGIIRTSVDRTPVRLSGPVGPSIYGAARQAGATPSLAADYVRAIARRVDMSRISPLDRFDMVFEHRRAATGEETFGRLLYAGLLHDGRVLQLAPWRADGRERWFDATGAGETRGGFTMPVTGAQLSSGFGLRFHPLLGFTRMHQGVDLAAPYGTPIVAATDGVVGFAGWKGDYGNFVQILRGGGSGTGYGHMAAIVVRPGDMVRQGQLLGYVGSTGLSTGPHCHFEVYENGVTIDPATATFETTERLTGPALTHFRAAMARWTALPASS